MDDEQLIELFFARSEEAITKTARNTDLTATVLQTESYRILRTRRKLSMIHTIPPGP